MTGAGPDVAGRVSRVREAIERAAARSGRRGSDVTLMAVGKGVSWERIAEALPHVEDVGENRAQELTAKKEQLDRWILEHPEHTLRWHFIGALQRNKIRTVVAKVQTISVHSVALAQGMAHAATQRGIVQDVLLEVNTSGEPTKQGIAPERAADVSGEMAALGGLRLCGFMTIAAPNDERAARRSFAMLRELRDAVVRALPSASELSMGMSGDLEVAVEEGATIVRVGTAIFGERPG